VGGTARGGLFLDAGERDRWGPNDDDGDDDDGDDDK